jgi:hypothetical protein
MKFYNKDGTVKDIPLWSLGDDGDPPVVTTDLDLDRLELVVSNP